MPLDKIRTFLVFWIWVLLSQPQENPSPKVTSQLWVCLVPDAPSVLGVPTASEPVSFQLHSFTQLQRQSLCFAVLSNNTIPAALHTVGYSGSRSDIPSQRSLKWLYPTPSAHLLLLLPLEVVLNLRVSTPRGGNLETLSQVFTIATL